MPAAFEEIWLARLNAVVQEVTLLLTVVRHLCGDPETVSALQAGDESARWQLFDAFGSLASIAERFRELGPAPQSFGVVAAIVDRGFATLTSAASAITAGTEGDDLLDQLQSVPGLFREGAALFSELGLDGDADST